MSTQPLNLNSTTPAAAAGSVNVPFAADAPNVDLAVVRNVSVSVPVATASVAGLLPTPPNDATKVLNGKAAWVSPAAPATMTNLAGGLVPTPPNSATEYLDGTGNFSTPAGGGGGGGGGGVAISTSGLGYVIPAWNPSDSTIVSNGQIVASPNQLLVTQFVLRDTLTVVHFTFDVTNGGGNSALGLYDQSGNKLVAADNVNTGSTGVHRVAVTSTVLSPGIYYWVQCADNTSVQMACLQTSSVFNNLLNAGTVVRQGTAANAMSSGILPSTLGALTAALAYPVMAVLEP